MPIWLWLIFLTIGLVMLGYRKYSEQAALRRRKEQLAQQRDPQGNPRTEA
jgi:hypothetical protein